MYYRIVMKIDHCMDRMWSPPIGSRDLLTMFCLISRKLLSLSLNISIYDTDRAQIILIF